MNDSRIGNSSKSKLEMSVLSTNTSPITTAQETSSVNIVTFDLSGSPVPSKFKFNVTKLKDDGTALDINNNVADINDSNDSIICKELCDDDFVQPSTPDEALPDLDNYRNMLSLNGVSKSRPTLLELQVISNLK
jgi:hypothetical protein